MTSSIFESKKKAEKTQKIAIPCPAQLAADIEDVKAQLAAIDPDMSFNVEALCIDALSKAVRRAKKELSEMGSSPSPSSATSKITKDGTMDGGG